MTPALEVLKETIKRLIHKANYRSLERVLEKTHKGDIAYIFTYLSRDERVKTFEILMKIDIKKASAVLSDLEEDIKLDLLRTLPLKESTRIILTLSTNEIAQIIDKVPKELQEAVLEKLEEEDKEKIEEIISSGADTIKSIIKEDYIAINEEETVLECLAQVKKLSSQIEIIYIYSVDSKNRLSGVISLAEILSYPEDTQLKDIINKDVIALKEDTSKEEAVEIFKRYNFLVLPVVDEERTLIGVIHIYDILDVISEKTTEEFFKMAGAREEELFYTNQIFKVAKLRLPWMLFAIVGEFITAFIISNFSSTIEEFLPIIFFLPMVAAISGNISSQAAIITARGILTGRIMENYKDFILTLIKEIKVAFVLGLIISLIVGVVAFIWIINHKLGIVVALALFSNILIASVVGGFIPYIMYKLNKDPTIATGPIILTLNDIIGITIYLSVATIFVHYLKV